MTPTTREITELWSVEAVCDGQWCVQAPVCMDRKNAELHLSMFREGEQLRITRWVPDDSIESEVRNLNASRLIDAWVAERGQIPWAKAVEIVAIVTKMSEEEKQRLIGLDES